MHFSLTNIVKAMTTTPATVNQVGWADNVVKAFILWTPTILIVVACLIVVFSFIVRFR